MSRRPRGDHGVYAVLYALVVVVLSLTAALVVDISGLREDRRVERLATDAAATAGAIHLSALAGAVDPHSACVDAWAFLKANLPGAASAGASCPTSTFPTSASTCPSTARTNGAAAGPWQVTITWPVPNDDPAVPGDSPLLEQPDITGRGSYVQPPDPEADGTDPCGRLGVTVGRSRSFLLAPVAGFTSGATANTSVARSDIRGDIKQEFPLVILDQHGCTTILAQGSGPQDGTIRVLNNGLTPGRIALDSAGDDPANSGHGCANSNSYVAVAGGGGRVQAFNGSGGAPGLLLTYASLAKTVRSPGGVCALGSDPSATPQGTVCPQPRPYPRVTRKFWDWQYHCSASTSAPLSEPCPDTTPDYIGQLQSTLGTMTKASAPPSFTVLPTTDDDPAFCDYTGSAYRYIAPGNYFINCTTFNVNRTTVFGGGTLVFKGGTGNGQGINVKNNGTGPHCLVLNEPIGITAPPLVSGDYAACAPTSSTVANAPLGDMIVYLQKGDLSRQNADYIAPRTFLYQESDPARGGSRTSRIDLGAGTNSNLLITAPEDGQFENLAIWSDNQAGVSNAESQANQLGSQNKLALEGILFLPNGLVNFGGNPTYLGSARAQFVAWRLSVAGGGTLELLPDADRTLTIPVGGVRLIR